MTAKKKVEKEAPKRVKSVSHVRVRDLRSGLVVREFSDAEHADDVKAHGLKSVKELAQKWVKSQVDRAEKLYKKTVPSYEIEDVE